MLILRDESFRVTTLDRYLLSRYFHILAVFFVAMMGLYVVADGFTNLDEFQAAAGDGGTSALIKLMGRHYLYHSSLMFSLTGPTLAVMSSMCVLILSLKHGEVHPVLAAGVPLYRMAAPLVVGVLLVNGLLTANQEWIIPRISQHFVGTRGDSTSDAQKVDPTYDSQGIFVAGNELYLDRQMIHGARFLIPRSLVEESMTLRAEEATFHPATGSRPAGWLLKNVNVPLERIVPTEAGRRVLFAQQNGEDIFIQSGLTFDQLYNRSMGFRYLSTEKLLTRIRNPSAGLAVRRSQVIHLHERLTRPVLTLIGLFLVIPLTTRREKQSLVTNVAVCMGVVGVVYAFAQGMLLFGNTGLLPPAHCAWLPLITAGALATWLSPLAQT